MNVETGIRCCHVLVKMGWVSGGSFCVVELGRVELSSRL